MFSLSSPLTSFKIQTNRFWMLVQTKPSACDLLKYGKYAMDTITFFYHYNTSLVKNQ